MSTNYTQSNFRQPGFGNRGGGGGRRNNDSRPYRGHGPSSQPILSHLPRGTPAVPGRVLLANVPQGSQPLLVGPSMTGPNARAPTVFPQSYSFIPPNLHQQMIVQNPAAAAALPTPHQYYISQQAAPGAYATQQPINLGMNTTQLTGATAPQQISAGGMHGIPQLMQATVNTGTTNQVSATNVPTYNRPPPRTQPQQARKSKAIKIIDPSTFKEVSVGESSKPEVQQPAVIPDSTGVQVPPPPVITAVPPQTSSAAQDFKRRVHEINSTGAAVQEPVPLALKPSLPNAIITDPNKVGGDPNVTGGEPTISKQTIEVGVTSQEEQPNVPPASATPPVSESTKLGIREEFMQKVRQSVQTPPPSKDEKPTANDTKSDEQEEGVASQTVLEPQAPPPPTATVPLLEASAPPEAMVKVEESKSEVEVCEAKEEKEAVLMTTTDTVEPAVESETDDKSKEPPAIEAVSDIVPPESDSVDKQVPDTTTVVSTTVAPTSSEVVPPDSTKQEEISDTLQVKDTDSELKDSEAAKLSQGEEEKAVSSEGEGRKEESAEPSLPPQAALEEEPVKKDVNVEPTSLEKEKEEKEEPVSDKAVVEDVSSSKPLPGEQLPVDSENTGRTKLSENIETEAVKEPQTAAVEEKEPSLPSEVKATEQPKEAIKPAKQVEQQPSQVVNPVRPAEKERTSPPPTTTPAVTKPKEPVKPAEPVKSEKKAKPAPAKPSGVPASARLAPATEPPPSVSSLSGSERTMYQREFLLRFKETCTDVPPELEKSDVLKDHHPPSNTREREPRERDYSREYSRDFSRDYSMGRKGGRRQGDNRRGGNYQPVSKEPVDLHKAEHRWVRPTKVSGEEDGETEELFRKFQAILNKLTPQKFQNLAEQALNLKIDSDARLKGCIDKIFTKALEEPKFSIAYANLCKVMSVIKVEAPAGEDGKAKVVTFRRVLLTKCQQEFEKDKKDDEDREKMLTAIKETDEADKKKQLEDELTVWETKNRKRSLGNIRFIGELFKLKMLSETIMHECVVRLLRSSSDEESLECFAGLITTTGKDLDKPEAKTRINQYFSRITEIIKKGKVPARIKFMLQDVQDLRANGWVPRERQEQSLKTIDQIHHEAKVEEEKEKQFVAQVMASSRGGGGRDNRRGSLKPDDWQGGKGDRDRRDKDRDRDREKPKEKLDARRLQVMLKHREKSKDSGPPTLGPATFRPQGWGRGGSGATSTAQDSGKSDKDKRPLRTSSSTTKRSDKDKLPVGRGSGSGAKRAHTTPTPDSQNEKALAIQAVQQVTTKAQQQAAKSQPSGGKGEPKPVQDKMDEATVRRKTTTIVDELVQNKDFKEAIECVREMRSPGKMNFLVSEAINHSLEKSSQHRQFSGRLFSKLLKERMLSEAKFLEGLNEVLEFAEDIAIDIPKIWDYLGEILSHVVSTSALSLSFLASIYPSLLSSGKAGLLAAKMLVQCRSQLASDEEVASLWTASSLEWSTLGVPSEGEDIGEFLSRHGFSYLQCSSQLPSSDSQSLKYVDDLTNQFSAPDITNEDISQWIETNCPPPVRSTPEFVATVTTAIVNATVTGSGSSAQFHEERFTKRALSIKKYVDEKKDLQLRILYALQIAVAELKHPPGMLNNMFNQIYDLEIVGEDMFRQWKDKGTESFGKGAAVATVKNFFDWLDSCETESDDGT